MVHPVAAEGFSDAQRYERGRPGYPDEAVDWLVQGLAPASGPVLDVAAGTGKLTRPLLSRAFSVIAVEPLKAMYQPLRTRVPVVEAVAERLPFRAGTAQAITVGQAAHWFDRDVAAAEFLRVLAPGGTVGLIWNARDRSVDYMNELWQIMDAVEKRAPWRDHAAPRAHLMPGFAAPDAMSFEAVEHKLDRQGVHDRFLSVSHVAALPADRRAEVVGGIDRVLDRHFGRGSDSFSMPYRVDAYRLTPDA